jgi:hypothetical protein
VLLESLLSFMVIDSWTLIDLAINCFFLSFLDDDLILSVSCR